MAAAELDYEEMRYDSLFGREQATLFTVRDLKRDARQETVERIVAALPSICMMRKWGKGHRVQNRLIYLEMVNEFGWRISRTEREGALRLLKERGLVDPAGYKDCDYTVLNLVS